jgi:large subunit ribosomal protein L25
MQTSITIQTTAKTGAGTGNARAVRKQGMIPAIVYGLGKEYMLSLPSKEFIKEYNKGSILSKLVAISIDDQEVIHAITRDVQLHPVTDELLHVDFQQIEENKPIRISIRVKVTNESKCVGIKKGGLLNIVQRSISFYCLPSQIKPYIEIDISDLHIGQSIHINDITLPENMVPTSKSNFPILSIAGRADDTEKNDETTT